MFRIINFLEQVVKWLAIFFFSIMVLSALLQVFTRYVINTSIPWTDELARYAFVWSSMLGACLVHRKRGHVMIDAILSRFSAKGQSILAVTIDLLSLSILLLLTVQGVKLLSIGSMQTTPALGIKMSAVMLSVPVAGAYMSLTSLEHLFSDVKKLSTKPV